MPDLLSRSAGIAHALARARLGDTLLAEDAAAETLRRVARGLPGLSDPQSYLRWLARIAERCAADAARRQRYSPEPILEDPADSGGGPEAAARAVERARAIRGAVSALPRKLRAPVLLHYVEGLSYREVAAALGVGLGSVSRRIGKALSALKRALGEEP